MIPDEDIKTFCWAEGKLYEKKNKRLVAFFLLLFVYLAKRKMVYVQETKSEQHRDMNHSRIGRVKKERI